MNLSKLHITTKEYYIKPTLPLYICQARGQADGCGRGFTFILRSLNLSMDRTAVCYERCVQAADWVNLVRFIMLCAVILLWETVPGHQNTWHKLELWANNQNIQWTFPNRASFNSSCGCSFMTAQPKWEWIAFIWKVGSMWTWSTHLTTFTNMQLKWCAWIRHLLAKHRRGDLTLR